MTDLPDLSKQVAREFIGNHLDVAGILACYFKTSILVLDTNNSFKDSEVGLYKHSDFYNFKLDKYTSRLAFAKLDKTLQEVLLKTAQPANSLYQIASHLGYKNLVIGPAGVSVTCPSTLDRVHWYAGCIPYPNRTRPVI